MNFFWCFYIFYMCSKALGNTFCFTDRSLELTKGSFCGPYLERTVKAICKGLYNSPKPKQEKKSGIKIFIIALIIYFIHICNSL